MKIIQSSFLRNSFLGALFLIGLTGIEVKAQGWPSKSHCNACWDDYDKKWGRYCRPTDPKRWLLNHRMGWKSASIEVQRKYCIKCGMKHDQGWFNNYCER